MNSFALAAGGEPDTLKPDPNSPDSGLAALTAVAGYYRIAARPETLSRELALTRPASREDILRASMKLGLKAKVITVGDEKRLTTLPAPALASLSDGTFAVFGGVMGDGTYRVINPLDFSVRNMTPREVLDATHGKFILVQRKFAGAGAPAKTFGFSWFLPSIWRYRKAFGNVLLASLFVQLFALVTPLFFQVVVDKVLAHRSYSTLIVLVIGLVAIGLFDVVLQYLRTYALSHTTNRIDVELGRRLFRHLLNLPLYVGQIRWQRFGAGPRKCA